MQLLIGQCEVMHRTSGVLEGLGRHKKVVCTLTLFEHAAPK